MSSCRLRSGHHETGIYVRLRLSQGLTTWATDDLGGYDGHLRHDLGEAGMSYEIAKRSAFAWPVPVGWSSTGNHPMSHDKPLTESQFYHLLHSGVLRTDEEIKKADRRERKKK